MTIKRRQVTAAILASFSLWVVSQTLLAGTFRDNFDDGDMIGWKPNIAAGISVVDGELQFKGIEPLILKVGNSSWEGYSLEARVKIAKFTNGGWFSMRILQGGSGEPSGYCELRLTENGTVTALYVDDRCAESFRVPVVIEENVWHRVKIKPSNGKISFYIDGMLIGQLTDMKLSGYLDMCSIKGTHTYVDDVTISGPNIPDTGPCGPSSFVVKPRLKLATTWGEVKQLKTS